jgi:hypothetical protein
MHGFGLSQCGTCEIGEEDKYVFAFHFHKNWSKEEALSESWKHNGLGQPWFKCQTFHLDSELAGVHDQDQGHFLRKLVRKTNNLHMGCLSISLMHQSSNQAMSLAGKQIGIARKAR